MSTAERMIRWWRWLWTGDRLHGSPATPPPARTGIRSFLLSRDHLESVPATPARPSATSAPVPLYWYLLAPECLAPPIDEPRPRSLARPDRGHFWRWLLTPETLPRADAGPTGGARSHPKER